MIRVGELLPQVRWGGALVAGVEQAEPKAVCRAAGPGGVGDLEVEGAEVATQRGWEDLGELAEIVGAGEEEAEVGQSV